MPGLASPIRAYRQNLCQMRKSNDPSESEPTYLGSLVGLNRVPGRVRSKGI